MRGQLETLTSRVESGEIQTYDEIRREFLNIVEEYLEEKVGILAHIKLERDIGEKLERDLGEGGLVWSTYNSCLSFRTSASGSSIPVYT